MDLGISGRVAIVTGGAGGIGQATARLLSQEGVRIVLSDREQDKVDAALGHLAGECCGIAADVTLQADVDALVAGAAERFGTVDIVVHASGVTGAKGDPLTVSDADYADAWATDFMSAVRIARRAIPLMRQGGWGRFVCIASENAVQPYWEEAVYNTAKAGLVAFIKGMSYREAAHGVLCNTVAPAFIETNMTDSMMKKRAEAMNVPVEEAIRSFLDEERPGIVQKRRGRPDEVAAAIALLVSDRASFINGSNLRVDGGSVTAIQN